MAVEDTKSRLFLSYSRLDSAFVDELVVLLESYEFEVVFDREDLFPGEPWEPRLRALVSEADTTVCIVSANWIASEQCKKEFVLAVEQGRRVIPVIVDPVRPADMPKELSRLQFVSFHGEGRSYAKSVVDLLKALRTDIGWVREQSRLLDKASEWASNNRSAALLLRGGALDRALDWIGGPAPDQTRVVPLVAEYVTASKTGLEDEEKKRLRGRVWLASLAGLALAGVLSSAALGGYIYLNGQLQAEQEARQTAENDLFIAETKPGAAIEPRDIEEDIERDGPESPASLVARLNDADRSTRLGAGQLVVERVRSTRSAEMLEQLVAELQGDKLDALTANGRFNVLYMLNVYDAWSSSLQAPALREALQTIESRASSGVAVGAQTRDCIAKLMRKLDGERGVGDECGSSY